MYLGGTTASGWQAWWVSKPSQHVASNTYFPYLVQECVASTFEGVGLYSDALAQYEEIEAGFLQCLQGEK